MASGDGLESTQRVLSEAEMEKFIKSNYFGFLAFAKGDKPYVIPVSYEYRKGTFIIGLSKGRKMDYLQKSRRVCFTISKPIALTGFKESCTGVMVEGELEEITDRSYYGLGPIPKNIDGTLFRIKVEEVGSKKCTAKQPCQVFTAKVRKDWVSVEEYARQKHEGTLER
jgi:hypothetical protein